MLPIELSLGSAQGVAVELVGCRQSSVTCVLFNSCFNPSHSCIQSQLDAFVYLAILFSSSNSISRLLYASITDEEPSPELLPTTLESWERTALPKCMAVFTVGETDLKVSFRTFENLRSDTSIALKRCFSTGTQSNRPPAHWTDSLMGRRRPISRAITRDRNHFKIRTWPCAAATSLNRSLRVSVIV